MDINHRKQTKYQCKVLALDKATVILKQ